jgi:DNA-binding IclR family transcriptional regulator
LRLLCAGVPPRTIRRLAQPILEGLAAEFGETAFVAKLAGEDVETVAVAPPVGERQAFVHPGRTMPFNAAASAKAILAYADARLVDAILAKNQEQFTSRTKTTKHEITAELAQIRRQGFAICNQELDPGVLGYACPIQIGNGGVVYSLGLVGLADRLGDSPPNEVVTSLKSAAEQLSTAIRDQGAMVVDLT